jgi:hypothetical protein
MAAFAAGACKHADLRPALLLPMSEAPRDPSPMRNPVDEHTHRAGPERGAVAPCEQTPVPVSTAERKAEEIVATLLGMLAGGQPILELFVRFDETAPFRPRDQPRGRPAAAGPSAPAAGAPARETPAFVAQDPCPG